MTTADYKRFINTLWPYVQTSALGQIVMGGDVYLSDPTDPQNHRAFLQVIWPYVMGLPNGRNAGIEILTPVLDRNNIVTSIKWIKATLSTPAFIGLQYYPPDKTTLANKGYVITDGSTATWTKLIDRFYTAAKAAAGRIPIVIEEAGLELTPPLSDTVLYNDQEQSDFLAATVAYLSGKNVKFDLWEYSDELGGGHFGLVKYDNTKQTLDARPGMGMVDWFLQGHSGFQAGIQYITSGYDGWQYINDLST